VSSRPSPPHGPTPIHLHTLPLATSERGVERWDAADLAQIAESALAVRDQLVQELGLTVDVSLSRAPVAGDTALLELVVANLVDNALRHNVAEGRVHVLTANA
jgi:signal transduction histidine kinase